MRNAKLYPLDCTRPAAARCFGLALALLAALPATATAAEPTLAAVEAVQWPVWVERSGGRRALAAGDALQAQDKLATGDGGRAMLRLADGSAVKLGENALLDIKGLNAGNGGVLNAALDVAKGAFRYTTGLFQARLHKRAVSVQVATLTAGIRGTDVWGKSDDERDLVCLLEGRITVSHINVGEAQIMDQALSFYTAPRGKLPGPVTSVDAEQVARWAAETEVEMGHGVGRAAGKWRVRLATLDTEAAALALIDKAGELGFPARALPQREGDGYRYDVQVRKLGSEAEARSVAVRLSVALSLPAVSVSR